MSGRRRGPGAPATPADDARATPRLVRAAAPVEAGLLARLRAHPDDDDARLVYADWLEESGQHRRAELLRIQCRLGTLSDDDPVTGTLRERARALSPAADAGWRTVTTRPPIERCDRRAPECPRAWSSLCPTEEASTRRCRACDELVHYCAALVEVRARGRRRERVVLDPSLVREEALELYDSIAPGDEREGSTE